MAQHRCISSSLVGASILKQQLVLLVLLVLPVWLLLYPWGVGTSSRCPWEGICKAWPPSVSHEEVCDVPHAVGQKQPGSVLRPVSQVRRMNLQRGEKEGHVMTIGLNNETPLPFHILFCLCEIFSRTSSPAVSIHTIICTLQ